jgi:carboxymethylenebutenolidase
MTITIGDIDLAPADEAAVSACLVVPAAPRGGVVLLQEIFGVNEHIRSVAARFAELGYGVVAPALFDRVERGVSLGYTPADIERGKALRARVSDADALRDIAAAITVAARFGEVAVIGYCWGGRLAWLAAARSPGLAAAVVYYPGGIGALVDEQPAVPTLLHFGASDPTIPPAEVEALRAGHPALPVHLYPAGHGFSCSARPGFDEPSHMLALDRTRAFLNAHIAGEG